MTEVAFKFKWIQCSFSRMSPGGVRHRISVTEGEHEIEL